MCRRRSWQQRWGHTRAEAPTQCPRPSHPSGMPQRGCRDTGDLQPLPGTTKMPPGSPGPVWNGVPLARLLSLLGDMGSGGKAQLPPHPPWEDECDLGAVGTVRDRDVVAVAANPGCDRARAPWHPHPFPGTQTGLELLRGLCPNNAPSSERHLPCERGLCLQVPSWCHGHLIPGAGSARAGRKTLPCEPSAPAVAPPRARCVPTFAVCW